MTNIELEAMVAIKNFCRTHNEVNWEQVRVQAAIAVLNKFAGHSESYEAAAETAVRYADALINELKKNSYDTD